MDACLVNQAFEMGSSYVYSMNHPATAACSMRPGSYPIWIQAPDGKTLKPPRTAMTYRELKLHDLIVLCQLLATWQAFTNGDPSDTDMTRVYLTVRRWCYTIQKYNKKGGIKNVTGVIVQTFHWTNSARLLTTVNKHQLNVQVNDVGNVDVGDVDVLHQNEDVEMEDVFGGFFVFLSSVLFKSYSKAPDFGKEPMSLSGATELGVVFFKNSDSKISHLFNIDVDLPLFQVLATTTFNLTKNQPVAAKVKVLGLHSILFGDKKLQVISRSFIRPVGGDHDPVLWNKLISPAWNDTWRRVWGYSLAMGIQDFVSGASLEEPESLVSVSDSDDVVLNAAISTHFGHGCVVQPMTSPQSMSKLEYIYMRAAVQQWLQLKESVPKIKQKVDSSATLTLNFQLSQRVQESSADDAWDFVFPQHTFQNLTLQTNEQPLNSKVLNVRPLVVALDGTSFNFEHTHGYKGAHMSGVMPSQ
ncbi:hypothetical protein BCR33DRAFT_739082 [Rhizoclosmatium globosum]|uniref:Uncharacterized protein n=1 Tax=Rhizoclosmatium globosum TaxID=329046 RepID=A0A1Y2C865_9FUNG|nr:hypothetical protein BCR33DRAFT_739082 [Rhizoclosmatium globosum]|eukprot:ORY42505.1 hypothetical protein BCR33DRAFT_739082 [Rhizoclosmatium globosum]